jgi:hypothetical protein
MTTIAITTNPMVEPTPMTAKSPVRVLERHTFLDIHVRSPEAIATRKRRAIRVKRGSTAVPSR